MSTSIKEFGVPLFVTLGLALLGYTTFAKANTSVTAISPLIKQVTVDGRRYLVLNLPGGLYTVTSVANPSVTLTFSQEKIEHEMGEPKQLAQLKADMNRFPPEAGAAL